MIKKIMGSLLALLVVLVTLICIPSAMIHLILNGLKLILDNTIKLFDYGFEMYHKHYVKPLLDKAEELLK